MQQNEKFTLKAWRVHRKMKQAEVAKLVGVTKGTLKNWEMNRTFPTIIQATKLAKVYGTSLDSIIFFE